VAVQRGGVEALLTELRRFAAAPPAPKSAAPAALLAREETVEVLYTRIQNLLADCVTQPATAPPWQDKLDSIVMHPVARLGGIAGRTAADVPGRVCLGGATGGFDRCRHGNDRGVCRRSLARRHPEGFPRQRHHCRHGQRAGVPAADHLPVPVHPGAGRHRLPAACCLPARPPDARVGLSGRSFIPMLSSFACAVPGIMATRTIQDPRERFITIMTAPLMTCSARLPVYALVIAAFIPERTVFGFLNLQGLTLFVLYIAGIISAALVAWLLRRRESREEFPLLLELPSYRWPMPYHVFLGLRERTMIFLKRVGTIILALSVLLWFLATYPHAPADATRAAIEYSYAGQLGLVDAAVVCATRIQLADVHRADSSDGRARSGGERPGHCVRRGR
jgi:ferrous iron transport protein B